MSQARSSRFWTCINNCNLLDLGFKGCRYTWSNHHRRHKGLVHEWLDKYFVNEEWPQNYPEASITHFPKTYSDHNHLLINTSSNITRPSNKPFWLESFWCSHREFHNIIRQRWQQNDLTQATSLLQHNVTSWIKATFGNIFHKKRRILARWDGT